MDGLLSINNRYRILDTRFEQVFSSAVTTTGLTKCLIQNCEFRSCGNGNNTGQYPIVPIVDFGNQSFDNLVIDCSSDRQQQFADQLQITGVDENDASEYISEVRYSAKTSLVNRNLIDIFPSNSRTSAFSLSGENHWYVINYVLKLGDATRHGQLHVSPNFDQNHVSLTDQHQFSTPFVDTSLGKVLADFEFSAEFRRTETNSPERDPDTILIKYKNPDIGEEDSSISNVGSLSFDVSYGV